MDYLDLYEIYRFISRSRNISPLPPIPTNKTLSLVVSFKISRQIDRKQEPACVLPILRNSYTSWNFFVMECPQNKLASALNNVENPAQHHQLDKSANKKLATDLCTANTNNWHCRYRMENTCAASLKYCQETAFSHVCYDTLYILFSQMFMVCLRRI